MKPLENQILAMIEEARTLNLNIQVGYCLRVVELAAQNYDEYASLHRRCLNGQIEETREECIIGNLKKYLDLKTRRYRIQGKQN